jgi:hypothetical protein
MAGLALLAGCHSLAGGRGAGADSLSADDDAPIASGGHYLGVAQLSHGGLQIPAQLDLVPAGKDSFRAVLRLAPGGAGSHEYVAAYFADVALAASTGALTFSGGPDDIRMANGMLKGGSFAASLTTAKDHSNATLMLTRKRPEDAASAPLGDGTVRPLTGRYTGTCDGRTAILDVEASKWHGAQEGDCGLFAGYRINGRWTEPNDSLCGRGQSCVKEAYTSGAYDLLGGSIAFLPAAGRNAKTCVVASSRVTCGTCALTKAPTLAQARKIPPRAEHLTLSDDGQPRSFKRDGQYYGYLSHEGRGIYQLLALNVKTADAVDPGTGESEAGREQLGAVATLYFGAGDSSELAAFRFKDAAVARAPSPKEEDARRADHRPLLVLDGSGETFLAIESWGPGGITGTWYSKSFGRVGTLELQRDLVPELSAGAATVGPIGGRYQGDGWDFDLAATAGISAEPGDFYPLKLYGWAQEKAGGARRRTVEEGTYDYYTGTVALRLDDGRMALGRVTAQGLELTWAPKPHAGAPLAREGGQLFRRVSETLQAVAPGTSRW